MEETTAAIRKIYEDSLLEAESKVKFYRRLLGKPLVEGNADCAEEVESLKSQLQEKTEELKSLKRSFYFTQESLTQLQDRLESCPVSGEVTLKLKGSYHTFFKARINHPNYSEGNMKDCSENPQAPIKDEAPDGKEPTSKGTGTGYNFYYKNPVTGEMVEVKPLTKYEALELKYNDMREDNNRLLRRVASQKTENELLQCEVHNLSCKLSQAYRECDKFKDKLRELRQLIDEVCQ